MSDSQFHSNIQGKTADQIYFALAMFPYPSGAGLHVGHAENYIYVDIISRYQRMQGKTVITTIWRDAFGLPTENYALKQGKPAHIVTQENIDNFIAQCKMLDLSYDRDREINTSHTKYYKWTQWIFIKLFEQGLVYRKDALVNRCNGCQTVLANDQIKEGKCERCETDIIQKKHPQRFIKITDYADRLIQDLNLVDRPEETKIHQKNRIGKSEWVEVNFAIQWWKKEIWPKKILIYQCKWSEIQENEISTVELKKLYETTDDGFVKNVRAFVKNEKWDILMLYESRYNRRVVPGGKVDVGMTLDQALQNEIQEELWVQITQSNFLGARKCYMRSSKWINKRLAYYYDIHIDGKPYNKEPEKAEIYDFITIQKKQKWRSLSYGDIVLDDPQKICDQFPGLHTLVNVLPHMPLQDPEHIKFETISTIDPAWEYVQYYDTWDHTYHIVTLDQRKQNDQTTITVYTTRPETIYGVTALMLAPENESLDTLLDDQTKKKLQDYREQTSAKTNIERQHTDKNKSWLFSGMYATHPLTNEEIPVWYADYVLVDYATGAVMFVPAHDERDYEFAQTINSSLSKPSLAIKQVIAPSFTKSSNPDVVNYRRDAVRAIIKHPTEDRYLFLTAHDWIVRFVGGGIEEGLNLEESLLKEIMEETGYTDINIVHNQILTIHFSKYTKTKWINSYGYCYYYYCQLNSLQQETISPEEFNKHQPVWMTPQQVDEYGTDIHFIRNHRKSNHRWLYTWDGVMINCDSKLNMLPVSQAQEMIIQSIEQQWVWSRKINYKLRDWSVSRQRYRGSPIPIYYTFEDNENWIYTAYNPHPDKSKWIPHLIPQEELPVILPLDLENYKPAGKSPLEDHPTFKYYHNNWNIYLRECDTLDTFMCSTYYYLRFLDPDNTQQIIDPEIEKVAMPVDFYMWGKEHIVWHLLYSRFIYKFLYDQSYVSHVEPFAKLIHQGMVLASDGRKMSKRRGNVINSSEIIKQYGVDVIRVYIAFMGPYEQDKCRDDNALWWVKRFLNRVERLKDLISTHESWTKTKSILHQTIKWVTEDIINLKYNTAISKLMILTNHFYEIKTLTQSDYSILLLLLAPFATQFTATLRSQIWETDDIHYHIWPFYDKYQIASGSVTLAIQINGKMRWTITVDPRASQDQVLQLAQADEKIAKYIVWQIIKVIFIQDKILNIIVN
jgi:leucyl-tRNA synthetase